MKQCNVKKKIHQNDVFSKREVPKIKEPQDKKK